jgi:hypothetical protein
MEPLQGAEELAEGAYARALLKEIPSGSLKRDLTVAKGELQAENYEGSLKEDKGRAREYQL